MSADASAALSAAVAKMKQESFRSTIDMGPEGVMRGVTDPRRNASEYVAESDSVAGGPGLISETRIVGGAGYQRRLLAGAEHLGWDGKTWNKVKGTGHDATNVAVRLDAASDVKVPPAAETISD